MRISSVYFPTSLSLSAVCSRIINRYDGSPTLLCHLGNSAANVLEAIAMMIGVEVTSFFNTYLGHSIEIQQQVCFLENAINQNTRRVPLERNTEEC